MNESSQKDWHIAIRVQQTLSHASSFHTHQTVYTQNRLTRIFQEDSGQVTVSIQQHSQQQPGIAPRVRGQQPQLTCRGRLAHEAISEGEMKENNVDSSAVSGECTDSSPLSKRQQRRGKRVTSEWQSLDSWLLWLTIWEEIVSVPQ